MTDDVLTFVVGWSEFVPLDKTCRAVQIADNPAGDVKTYGRVYRDLLASDVPP